MKTTTLIASAAAALALCWTTLAFVRCGMIMTIACGFAGTSAGDHLVTDARMSFFLGCVGATVLSAVVLGCLVRRLRLGLRPDAAFHPAGLGHLPSV
jgi:hypothetical protein